MNLILHSIKYIFIASLMLHTACGSDSGDDGISDIQPKISINNVTIFEGNENTTLDFKVLLSSVYNEVVRVDYATENGTAEAGDDFVIQNGTLSFNIGEKEKFISIEILGDTLLEEDETIKLILTNAVNATIADGKATGILINDDTFSPAADDGYTSPDSYSGYTLIWRDEFEASNIDMNSWTHEDGNHGWGNNELQNYTSRSENSYISDGKLVIEAKEENFGGSNYTSARMITAGKQEFKFGRIDIRAKLPEGQGIWPALWMLGANFFTTGWPSCGEIDIMELVGHEPDIVHGTGHWGVQGSPSTFIGNAYQATKKYSEEYYVFTIIWEENEIKWFVNDQQFFILNKDTIGSLYPFNAPFFFIFNIAVGGNWPGNPDATTVFPQRMFIDYIRVFQ